MLGIDEFIAEWDARLAGTYVEPESVVTEFEDTHSLDECDSYLLEADGSEAEDCYDGPEAEDCYDGGTRVTFRYQELTDDGIPRFPTYVGVRCD